MKRISKESLIAGRNSPVGSENQRGRRLTVNSRGSDENLDLFSRNRRSLSIAFSEEMDASMKFERLPIGSAKPARNGLDDLLSSVDREKHDYDWLLTPPGTPNISSLNANEPQPTSEAPKGKMRSASTTKASRLSAAHSDNSYSSRSIRSSSLTRPCISSMPNNTYSSNSTRSSSILNTSSASVTSSSRTSTPPTRSNFPFKVRPSTPSTRSLPSRSSTPMKSRPTPTNNSSDKTRTTQSSRPQTSRNVTSPAARSSSQPSTPTRRASSAGKTVLNGRNPAPNLRTTLPNRPVSAGSSRPVTARGNLEAPMPLNPPRRQSSPVVSRRRLSQSPGKGHMHANGNARATETQKTQPVSETALRKHAKPATVTDSTGFGRTISKNSLDMAMKHMDIRHGTGSIRSLSGTTVFPPSIRGPSKGKPSRALDAPNSNGAISEKRSSNGPLNAETKEEEDVFQLSAKLSESDKLDSSRYDSFLLKEDFKSTNWLHSVDDNSDPGLVFDNRFEPLPEPFGLL